MIKTVKNPPEKDVLAVILDDEIYDRHTDDTDPPKHKLGAANLSGWVTLCGYVEGNIASLFLVKDGQLHFYCLKPYRRHARTLLNQALKTHRKPVFCEIPVLYLETINFALKAGFRRLQRKRDAWVKNGQIYDVEVLRWAR